MPHHDVIIIGAGPAGDFAAALAIEENLDVAQIEEELFGGECAYWGCMPSKALLRPGELLAETRRVPGLPEGDLDVPAVLARRDEVINHLDDSDHVQRQAERGVALYRGRGRLDGDRRVVVTAADGTTQLLEANRAVIIATGSSADIPPIPGLVELSPWTNREATTAGSAPESLLILGGGPIGCELAQAWCTLGTQVTLIEAEPLLLPGAEPFAGELICDALRREGVDVRTGVRATRASRDDQGQVQLSLDSGEQLAAAQILVSIGRRANTGDLGLESVDLAPAEPIAVDDQMRVPHRGDWLYAVGDVNGRAQLSHAGKYQAMIALATIMNRPASADWDGPLSPQVIFTEPQVASVGQTLAAALDAGIPARAIDDDPADTPGASFVGRDCPSGARIVVDTEREVIIGATFVAPEIVELLQAATFAIVGEVPLRRLAHGMGAYPTRSEVWLGLLADWRP